MSDLSFFTGDWENDSYIMYCFLDSVDFYTGTESCKMNNGKYKKAGRMLYGLTWKTFLRRNPETGEKEYRPLSKENPKMAYTKVRCEHPILEDVFKEFASLYFPDFKYTSTQLTRNFEIKRHIDSKNIGDSVLVAFGEYEGGETVIEVGKDNLVIDARKKPYKFNGSKYYHYVKPFTGGDRYSLVFFNK